ncbi:hypothetical protein CEXT_90371 [Caerostris extrusa]|uniref:Uncharacterized protein n=1 Tax=Caerostris extrusa TaxID=172846 RepID=A0AAV4Y572_CAEEX|nr:hypothetical protein CEXT_90371 [Caerostris extrusa]
MQIVSQWDLIPHNVSLDGQVALPTIASDATINASANVPLRTLGKSSTSTHTTPASLLAQRHCGPPLSTPSKSRQSRIPVPDSLIYGPDESPSPSPRQFVLGAPGRWFLSSIWFGEKGRSLSV